MSQLSFFKITVKVKRERMTIFEKSFDLCGKKEQSMGKLIKIIMGALAMPRKCPITEETTYCYNEEKLITLSKTSRRILEIIGVGQVGKITELVIAHDTGRSCFHEEHELIKL